MQRSTFYTKITKFCCFVHANCYWWACFGDQGAFFQHYIPCCNAKQTLCWYHIHAVNLSSSIRLIRRLRRFHIQIIELWPCGGTKEQFAFPCITLWQEEGFNQTPQPQRFAFVRLHECALQQALVHLQVRLPKYFLGRRNGRAVPSYLKLKKKCLCSCPACCVLGVSSVASVVMSDESVVCPICSLPLNSTEQREINAHVCFIIYKIFEKLT